MIGLNVGSADLFLRMVSMVLVPEGVGAILGNGYGIKGQNNADLVQGREVSL